MSGGPALRGVGARGALGARAVDGILLPATSDSRHSRRSLGISPAGAGGSAANCFACSAAASYTCPRCSVPYCSAACYRHARHACSEDFYRAEVEAELRRTQADAGSAQRMLAMLQRVEHEQQQLVDAAGRPRAIEDDDGEDDEDVAQAAAPGFGPDLADRLAGLDLEDGGDFDAAEVWARLTREEQLHFEQLMQNEAAAASLLPSGWRPWWLLAAGQPTAEPLQLAELVPLRAPTAQACSSSLPPLAALLPPGKAPARELLFNLLDLLTAYAAAVRHVLGDVGADPVQTVLVLLELSAVLADGAVLRSCRAAVQGVLGRLRAQPDLFRSDAAGLDLLDDVGTMLELSATRDSCKVVPLADVEVASGNGREEEAPLDSDDDDEEAEDPQSSPPSSTFLPPAAPELLAVPAALAHMREMVQAGRAALKRETRGKAPGAAAAASPAVAGSAPVPSPFVTSTRLTPAESKRLRAGLAAADKRLLFYEAWFAWLGVPPGQDMPRPDLLHHALEQVQRARESLAGELEQQTLAAQRAEHLRSAATQPGPLIQEL